MELREHVALSPRTTLGVGGNARYFVEARSEAEVVQALSWAAERGVSARVLGGGSNLVVADAGFDGLVIAVALRGIAIGSGPASGLLQVAAGEPWDGVVERAVGLGLAGIEGLSGIPGSTGATPIQNVGAYGQEVAETITRVRVIDRVTRSPRELGASECRFAYRDSFFKSEAPERFVVTRVDFALAERPPLPPTYPDLKRELARRELTSPSLVELRACVLAVRGEKSMLVDPHDENARSCGSFFLNPVVTAAQLEHVRTRAEVAPPAYPQPDGRVKLAAGWLIEQSGFEKGMRRGNVGLSSKHALAIVAHAGATAREVRDFAEHVRAGVAARFGVALTPEPSFWGD